jgi:hypothetical protein
LFVPKEVAQIHAYAKDFLALNADSVESSEKCIKWLNLCLLHFESAVVSPALRFLLDSVDRDQASGYATIDAMEAALNTEPRWFL